MSSKQITAAAFNQASFVMVLGRSLSEAEAVMAIEIPDEAISHTCGDPMKVMHCQAKVTAMGQPINIRCREHHRGIHDDEAKTATVDALRRYHASGTEGNGRLEST